MKAYFFFTRLFLFLSHALLHLFSYLEAEPLHIPVGGKAALLMNADSGAILFEKEAYLPHYPASTTKIATALYTLKVKKNDLNQLITAEQDCLVSISHEAKRQSNYTLPAYWQEPDGTHIGLKKGESMTLLDLLSGMLICSGNDAANVIAYSIGPTIPQFMEQVNAYLKEIGCKQTQLYNPHGLHHPQHQTTAYDLALMTKEALKEPIFCQIVAQTRYFRPKTNKQAATTLLQSNRLLRPGKYYYAKAIGVKTGYHSKAKKNLVAAARSEGRTLIAVLLGYDDRHVMFQDAIHLFETAFNQPKVQRTFLQAGKQSFSQVFRLGSRPLETYLKEPLCWDYYPAEDPEPKCLLYWQAQEPPIRKDQKVGELHLVAKNGMVLRRASLWALEDVRLMWPHNWMAKWSGFVKTFPLFSKLTMALSFISLVVSMWLFKFKSGEE